MKSYRADLHIHTLLSPCGDLEMSPDRIVARALEMKLDVIGITDHNSTRQCELIMQLGAEQGILVLGGAEVTTREEIHCLALFEDLTRLNTFQDILDRHLPGFNNDVKRFGYQVVVDRENNIIYSEEKLLINALTMGIEELRLTVRDLGGLFIPAHVDRQRFSILSQLGFIPTGLQPDAVEISANAIPQNILKQFPELLNYNIIRSSDAHTPDQVGSAFTILNLKELSFEAIQACFRNQGFIGPATGLQDHTQPGK